MKRRLYFVMVLIFFLSLFLLGSTSYASLYYYGSTAHYSPDGNSLIQGPSGHTDGISLVDTGASSFIALGGTSFTVSAWNGSALAECTIRDLDVRSEVHLSFYYSIIATTQIPTSSMIYVETLSPWPWPKSFDFRIDTTTNGYFDQAFYLNPGDALKLHIQAQSINGSTFAELTNVNIEITPSANAVPIPPTVWLLGSGLIGLLGVRRRFRKGEEK